VRIVIDGFEKKETKLEELIVEILEEFNKVSDLNLSSDAAKTIIAKAIVRKVEKMYEYNLKYFYK
jgi:hypothetical protein